MNSSHQKSYCRSIFNSATKFSPKIWLTSHGSKYQTYIRSDDTQLLVVMQKEANELHFKTCLHPISWKFSISFLEKKIEKYGRLVMLSTRLYLLTDYFTTLILNFSKNLVKYQIMVRCLLNQTFLLNSLTAKLVC